MSYAADTSVPVSKTRGQIEDLVQRAGGRRFVSMSEPPRLPRRRVAASPSPAPPR